MHSTESSCSVSSYTSFGTAAAAAANAGGAGRMTPSPQASPVLDRRLPWRPTSPTPALAPPSLLGGGGPSIDDDDDGAWSMSRQQHAVAEGSSFFWGAVT